MSYQKGELKKRVAPIYGPWPKSGNAPVLGNQRIVELPHSCEEWEIGTATEVRDLIADLEAALPWLEEEA